MKNLPVNFRFNKLLFQSIAFVILEKGLNQSFIFSHLLKLIPLACGVRWRVVSVKTIVFKFAINRCFSQFLKKNDIKT